MISLTKEECYKPLRAFYEMVAQKMGIALSEESKFDCRKICVTASVQNEIWEYYKAEKEMTDVQIGTLLLAFGPKANLLEQTPPQYLVQIEKGFVSE